MHFGKFKGSKIVMRVTKRRNFNGDFIKCDIYTKECDMIAARINSVICINAFISSTQGFI